MNECPLTRNAGSANEHKTRKRGEQRREAGSIEGKAISATEALHRTTSRGGIRTRGTEEVSAAGGTAVAAREEATEKTSSATLRPSRITTPTTLAKSPKWAKTATSRSVKTIVATAIVKAKVEVEEEMIVEAIEVEEEAAAATEASNAAVTTTRKRRGLRKEFDHCSLPVY